MLIINILLSVVLAFAITASLLDAVKLYNGRTIYPMTHGTLWGIFYFLCSVG